MATNGTVVSGQLTYAGVSTPGLISQMFGWLSVAYATTAFAPDIGKSLSLPFYVRTKLTACMFRHVLERSASW